MARWGRGVPALCRPVRNPRSGWLDDWGGALLDHLVLGGERSLRGTPFKYGGTGTATNRLVGSTGPCEEPLLGERGDRVTNRLVGSGPARNPL